MKWHQFRNWLLVALIVVFCVFYPDASIILDENLFTQSATIVMVLIVVIAFTPVRSFILNIKARIIHSEENQCDTDSSVAVLLIHGTFAQRAR